VFFRLGVIVKKIDKAYNNLNFDIQMGSYDMENGKQTKKKKSLSLAWKTAIYVICFGLLLGGAATFISYRTYKNALSGEIGNFAVSLAKTAGYVVASQDTKELETLSEENPVYQLKMSNLVNLKKNTGLSYLLITKIENGQTVNLYDADDIEVRYKPGEVINLAEMLSLKQVEDIVGSLSAGKEIVTETNNGYGWQMTAIVPIQNQEGHTVCIAAASVPMDTINRIKNRYMAHLSVLLLGITALLTGLAVWSTKAGIVDPILHATRAARDFADSADISEERIRELESFKSGDEIEELCHVIAGMKQEIIDYMEQLRKETAEKERQEAELSMAKNIQAGMLPYEFPNCKELEVYATMRPARVVGGDFYDFYYLDDDHLVLTIADVSGKGMPAALFMAISKALLQNTMVTCHSTEKVLEITNNLLVDNNAVEMFVTVWIGILEISTGRMCCTNAGHEYPALMKANGTFELFRDKHGLALAAMGNIKYSTYELQLEAGDRLFVYTDGVPEATATDGDLYGTDRLTESLNNAKKARPEELVEAVRKDIDRFVGETPQFDDITMLVLDYHGPQA